MYSFNILLSVILVTSSNAKKITEANADNCEGNNYYVNMLQLIKYIYKS